MVLLVLGSTASCIKNEVAVTAKLPENVNDAYRLLYYASDPKQGWYTETVIAIEKGVGEATLLTRNPTIVLVMHGGSVPEAGFYAERGDKIKIAGKEPSPFGWKISGNKINEEWSRWRIDNMAVLKDNGSGKVNEAVGKYVEKNPENPVSTILLLLYFDRRADDKQFRKLWGMLKNEALSPALIRLLGRTDMMEDAPVALEKIDKVVVSSRGNGVDTLVIGGKPTLLYFWREDDADREDNIGKLKELRKTYKDSLQAIIADISFDYDSISWDRKVSRDSLAGTVRGWLPTGETDSVVRRLGVERTPFVIVFDKKGKNLYRGDEMGRGITAFKNENATKTQNPKK